MRGVQKRRESRNGLLVSTNQQHHHPPPPNPTHHTRQPWMTEHDPAAWNQCRVVHEGKNPAPAAAPLHAQAQAQPKPSARTQQPTDPFVITGCVVASFGSAQSPCMKEGTNDGAMISASSIVVVSSAPRQPARPPRPQSKTKEKTNETPTTASKRAALARAVTPLPGCSPSISRVGLENDPLEGER